MTTPRGWYRFQNAADNPTVAELFIYSDIGQSWWDDTAVSAKQFMADLAALPPSVTALEVHINSLGGDVFDGVAIANALRDQSRSKGRIVTTIIDGIAASVASIVAMAGETIRIADNGLVMVHEPWTIAIGNAGEMRGVADRLDTIRDASLVPTYQWHSTLSAEEIRALLEAETWMDADEAIAKGFATEKVEGLKAAASLDARAMAKLTIPDHFRARVEALLAPPPAPPAPPVPAPVAASAVDVLRLCREGEVSDLAEGLIAAGATIDVVQAAIGEAKTARAAAAARSAEITALCAKAKLPELAEGYIAGAMTPAAIKAHLTTLTAKLDQVEIDGSLDPAHGSAPKARIDVSAVYAARNRS